MAKITWKPGTLLAPVPPALISCGTLEKPNVMTAAWTGIISSDPVITYVSVRPSRFSHGLIKESGEFVINLPTAALVTAV
ncbi:MAG: flavin reductase family protein, partial [Alphaproteobacteria bacterium]